MGSQRLSWGLKLVHGADCASQHLVLLRVVVHGGRHLMLMLYQCRYLMLPVLLLYGRAHLILLLPCLLLLLFYRHTLGMLIGAELIIDWVVFRWCWKISLIEESFVNLVWRAILFWHLWYCCERGGCYMQGTCYLVYCGYVCPLLPMNAQ